ncbi:MAG: serine/threonine-protein kinase, partial [Haliangium ochraceum]
QARKVTGPPNINVTLSLLIQLCDALEYAHTREDENGEPLGLVHRDVSPSNLLVTKSGHLKVIDFGIAKAQSQQLRTQTGRVKGKLAYMAPEAISGKELDSRSDIFSAGVIAHELLTARPLFASKNEYQTLINVQRSDILPPSAFNQAVPPELDAIVLKAVASEPQDRFQDAEAFAVALERAVDVASPHLVKTWFEPIASRELSERARLIQRINKRFAHPTPQPGALRMSFPTAADAAPETRVRPLERPVEMRPEAGFAPSSDAPRPVSVPPELTDVTTVSPVLPRSMPPGERRVAEKASVVTVGPR